MFSRATIFFYFRGGGGGGEGYVPPSVSLPVDKICTVNNFYIL